MGKNTILLADDEFAARVVMRDRLNAEGFEIVEAESGEEAVSISKECMPALVLMDVNFGDGIDGFEATRRIKAHCKDYFVPVILCTVRDDIKSKLAGLDFGADDYITKPFDLTELVVRVRSMLRIRELMENNKMLQAKNEALFLREKRLERENKALRSRLVGPDGHYPVIGESPQMIRLFSLVEKVAATSETVLITGETGVGKEVVARMVHQASDRSDHSMLILDCPSVPDGLFESELFGHKKGAFSGAHEDRQGILAEGDGSTVLLDEIGELSGAIQSKLLRFLQDSTVRPVGCDHSKKVSVRILAATNRDLEVMVEHGEFRRDLYYRLSVLRLHVPPLRNRWEDLPLLAHSFLERFNEKHRRCVEAITPAALKELAKVPLPGNVRQLKNIVTFAATLTGDGESIGPERFAETLAYFVARPESPVIGEDSDLKSIKEETERRIIRETLDRFGRDRNKTAKALGISRQGLWKKMKRLGFAEKK